MTDNVYSITEIVGSSTKSIEDAIRNAVATASESVRNIEWFDVVSTRGWVESGKVQHFQVTIKLGFRYEK